MIVDDEPHAREGLRIRLRREPDVLVIGEFGDAESALGAMASDMPDVLFLDIEMPGANGFALLERARAGPMPIVIFVTAYDRHAVQAFEARALDYLLKPVEQERLRESLHRAREQLVSAQSVEFAQRVQGLSRELGAGGASASSGEMSARAGKGADRIPVTVDGTIHFVATKDIRLHRGLGRLRDRARGRGGAYHSQVDERDARHARRVEVRARPSLDDREPLAGGEGRAVFARGVHSGVARGREAQGESGVSGCPCRAVRAWRRVIEYLETS